MTITEALDATLADGGGTFDAHTFAPLGATWAWAVGGGIPGHTIELVAERDLEGALAQAFAALVDAGADVIGTWLDEGVLYVDAVDLIEDTDEAIRLAAERGELAIYHLTTKTTLEVSR